MVFVEIEPLPESDINVDGCVNTADIGLLLGRFGTAGPESDVNLDGIVDALDLGVLLEAFEPFCP